MFLHFSGTATQLSNTSKQVQPTYTKQISGPDFPPKEYPFTDSINGDLTKNLLAEINGLKISPCMCRPCSLCKSYAALSSKVTLPTDREKSKDFL